MGFFFNSLKEIEGTKGKDPVPYKERVVHEFSLKEVKELLNARQ